MYWMERRTECISTGKTVWRSGRHYRNHFDKIRWYGKRWIAIAIQSELHVPVKYIGIGEQIDDLQKFDADQFVDALFE